MKRKLSAEEAAPCLAAADLWRSHPRLTGHVQRLTETKNPWKVLQRYEHRAHAEGQRCCVHVAAWVALLPSGSVLLEPAAQLLSKLLSTRPKTRYSPWFHGTLQLVAERIRQMNGLTEIWKDLRQRLPRRIWQPDTSDDKELEVKRLQTAISKWHNANASERFEIFQQLQVQVSTGGFSLRLLRKLVATLSPPRAVAVGPEPGVGGEGVCEDGGPSQKDLRKLLLKVLQKVDLNDAKLIPVLSRVEQLIQHFGQPLEEAASSAQWLKISSILEGLDQRAHGRWSDREKEEVWSYLKCELGRYAEANSVLFEKASKRFRRSCSAIKAFYRSQTDERYAPAQADGRKHERGMIKQLVGEAMQKLGGEATSLELIDCIRSDVQLQRSYGHRLQMHMTKINGNMNTLPAWQRTVRTNVDRYCRVTGKKRQGRIVYRIRTS